MLNTTNNTNFKGVRSNTNKTNGSVSAVNIERVQRKAMHKLCEDENGNTRFIVVKRIDVDDIGTMTECYQTVGASPVVFALGELEQEDKQLSVRKENKDGVLTNAKEVPVGPTKTYRLYNNIILVSFKNAEGRYDDFRLNGIELNGQKYYPVSGSASMGKKSKVYFSNHDADVQFNIMNRLTGGLLSEVLEKEGAALDEANFDKIAGIASRISLCATTPSLWPESGKTNNVFYFHGSIESEDEQTNIKDIGNDFRDGYGVFGDRIVSEMVSELAEEKVSCAQARRMSVQARVRGAAGKGHFRAYGLNQKIKSIKGMMEIDINKCYCWEDGQKVDLTKLSEKELTRLAAKIDIIADKDVFKWGKYIIDKETIDKMEIGIVNMSNLTTGSMGTQIIFKSRDDVEDAIKYIEAITERQLVEAEAAKGKVSFEDGVVRLSNTAYFNCYNLAPERAETDKLLNNFKIKQLDTALLSKVANLKLSINSNYLRMVPEDHLLNDRKEVLGTRDVNYVMPNGEVMTVRALEVYSSAFIRQYEEMKETLASNTAMTPEEKDIILNNMRICTAIKSPSQGDNEFEVFYMVTKEEIIARNATMEYLQFIEECPNNCIILAQDNTVKHQLAGSDFDGDDVTVIYPEFTMLENGKIITGLYYNDEIINDYTSIIVRKRVREGNIGYAALIIYDQNEPVRFTEEQEEKVEQDKVADYINNMDISSLF